MTDTKTTGGARRDRTADLLHAMQALSQLSYSPEWRRRGDFREGGGLCQGKGIIQEELSRF